MENELERAVALASAGGWISRDCLSPRVVESADLQPQQGSVVGQQRGSLREARKRFEREFLSSVLELNGGNATKAAKELGISRQMLQKKIKDWSLRGPRPQ